MDKINTYEEAALRAINDYSYSYINYSYNSHNLEPDLQYISRELITQELCKKSYYY